MLLNEAKNNQDKSSFDNYIFISMLETKDIKINNLSKEIGVLEERNRQLELAINELSINIQINSLL